MQHATVGLFFYHGIDMIGLFFNSLLVTIEMHKVSLQDDESGLFLIMTSPGVVRLSIINKETSDIKLRACNTLSMTHVSICHHAGNTV